MEMNRSHAAPRKERIDEITILRAFAFFAIVLQHCIGEYIYRPDIPAEQAIFLGMIYHFTRYGTLTFVFLSAVILFYNYDYTVPYGNFLKRRAAAILAPFAIWTVIYGIYTLRGQLLEPEGWRLLASQFITPTYGYQLWFVLMIFQLYLIFPWLDRGARAIGRRIRSRSAGQGQIGRRVVLLLGALAAGYAGLMYWSYSVAPAWDAPVWLQPLLGHRTMLLPFYFFYIALGIVCAWHVQRWRDLMRRSVPWSLLLFIIFYTYAGYRLLEAGVAPINLNISTYLKPSVFLLILAQLPLMYALALYVCRRKGKAYRILHKIGTYSFGGYLVHALVLGQIARFTREIPLAGMHAALTLITWVAVAALSIGITMLLDRLPFGVWLTGPMGRRQAASAKQLGSKPAALPYR